MKKITSVILTSAVIVNLLFAMTACGNTDAAKKTESFDSVISSAVGGESVESSSEESAASEPATEELASEESSSQEPVTTELQVVETGTVLDYKMAFYFDESVASNEADVIKKVVQNISNGYESITDESMLNDEDTYQLFWAAEKGATLTIPIEVPTSGKYDIKFCLHTGGDFGTHQIFLGETLLTDSEDINLYSEEGGLTDFELGEVELAAGETELMIRCTGQDEASAGSVFGISTMTLTNKEIN